MCRRRHGDHDARFHLITGTGLAVVPRSTKRLDGRREVSSLDVARRDVGVGGLCGRFVSCCPWRGKVGLGLAQPMSLDCVSAASAVEASPLPPRSCTFCAAALIELACRPRSLNNASSAARLAWSTLMDRSATNNNLLTRCGLLSDWRPFANKRQVGMTKGVVHYFGRRRRRGRAGRLDGHFYRLGWGLHDRC